MSENSDGGPKTLEDCDANDRRVLNHYLVFLVGLTVVYLVFELGWPRFPSTDELYFKASGRWLAETGRFAAPELTGLLNFLQPGPEDIFFFYPPLYSLLFGAFVAIVGFDFYTCLAFDALIHALLVLVTFVVADRTRRIFELNLNRRLPQVSSLLPSILILSSGIAGRPDELAMSLAMAALVPLLRVRRNAWADWVSGLFFGLAAATSTGPAIEIGLIALSLILFEPTRFKERIRSLAVITMGLIIVLTVVVGPILILRPDALQQYFAVGKLYAGRSSVLGGLLFAWQTGKHRCLGILASLVLLLSHFVFSKSVFTACGQSVRNSLRFHLGWVLALAFVVSMFPAKYTYLWHITPWMFVLSIFAAFDLGRELAWIPGTPTVKSSTCKIASITQISRTGVIGVSFICLTISYAWPAKDALCRLTLSHEQSAAHCRQLLRTSIPRGSRIVTSDHWWFLTRDWTVYDTMFSNVGGDEIDYFVLSGNGSGSPGVEQFPPVPKYRELLASEFEVAVDGLSRKPLIIAGVRITESAWGHGFRIYKRRTKDKRPL